jgi:hypothetical protein
MNQHSPAPEKQVLPAYCEVYELFSMTQRHEMVRDVPVHVLFRQPRTKPAMSGLCLNGCVPSFYVIRISDSTYSEGCKTLTVPM